MMIISAAKTPTRPMYIPFVKTLRSLTVDMLNACALYGNTVSVTL